MSALGLPAGTARLAAAAAPAAAADWRSWTPGLIDADPRTLGEVLDTLPGAQPGDIHYLVRLIENPASPVALPGAVALVRHDPIHVMLGRGLLNQDEAFVIGYTMGTARRIRAIHGWAFKRIARWMYPGIYRLDRGDTLVFDLGFALGRQTAGRRLHLFPFEDHRDMPVGALRRRLGIDPEMLRRAYREERRLLPGTPASERLPV